MSFLFHGEQICTRCGCKFKWETICLEAGEFLFGRNNPTKSCVINCTRINMTNCYSIELGCPECGHRDFVDVVRE